MGYNPNKDSVKEQKAVLDFMLEASNDFMLPSGDPRKLAYKIRKAIKGIEKFPKSFPEYQPLIGKFTLKEKDDHVQFIKRANLVAGSPVAITPEGLAATRSLSIEAVKTPREIVGAAIKHKARTIEFPDASPTIEDMTKIYAWASQNGYHIPIVNGPFTLSQDKPVNEWQPDLKSTS